MYSITLYRYIILYAYMPKIYNLLVQHLRVWMAVRKNIFAGTDEYMPSVRDQYRFILKETRLFLL